MAEQDSVAGFVGARQAVSDFMSAALEIDGQPAHLGAAWSETSVTDAYRFALHPRVQSVAFTGHQENEIGADLMIWFLDSASDEAFGVLCQAKNLRRTNAGRFNIDFAYNDGKQLRNLRQAGEELEVPCAYLIYAGPARYRIDLGEDLTSEELAVAVLPSLAAQRVATSFYQDEVAEDAMRIARPMESLVTAQPDPFMLLGLNQANEDFVSFLRAPQQGARCVAKEMLRILAQIRVGDLSAVLDKVRSTPIFADLPLDTGHFGTPYVLHVLRGVRTNLPHYASVALDRLQGVERIELSGLSSLDPGVSASVGELWFVSL